MANGNLEQGYTVVVQSGFTPAGNWPLIRAQHVSVNQTETLANYIPVILTQEEYNSLLDGETIEINGQNISYEENRIYMIIKENMT